MRRFPMGEQSQKRMAQVPGPMWQGAWLKRTEGSLGPALEGGKEGGKDVRIAEEDEMRLHK